MTLFFSVYVFRFREECKSAGKNLMVWTVNEPAHMMEVRGVIFLAFGAPLTRLVGREVGG